VLPDDRADKLFGIAVNKNAVVHRVALNFALSDELPILGKNFLLYARRDVTTLAVYAARLAARGNVGRPICAEVADRFLPYRASNA
jgi:hypothetical protein